MLFKKPLQTFANFFKKQSQPVTPVQPVRGGAQAAAQTQKPQLGPNEIDPAELRDQWQANHMGITPNQRAAANKNNPKHHMNPDELNDLFNSLQSGDNS
jgi:hypothetical protein